MAGAILAGLGLVGAGLGARWYFNALARQGKVGLDKFVKGGFQAKMDAKEAKAILGLK